MTLPAARMGDGAHHCAILRDEGTAPEQQESNRLPKDCIVLIFDLLLPGMQAGSGHTTHTAPSHTGIAVVFHLDLQPCRDPWNDAHTHRMARGLWHPRDGSRTRRHVLGGTCQVPIAMRFLPATARYLRKSLHPIPGSVWVRQPCEPREGLANNTLPQWRRCPPTCTGARCTFQYLKTKLALVNIASSIRTFASCDITAKCVLPPSHRTKIMAPDRNKLPPPDPAPASAPSDSAQGQVTARQAPTLDLCGCPT